MADGVAARNGRARPQGLRVGQPFNPYRLFAGVFIPEALVRYRGLSCGAKLAYGRLARFAGENGDCYPSITKLAKEIGMGTTQTRAYVHELSEKSFIVGKERPGSSAVYSFLWHEAFEGKVGEKRKSPPLQKTVGVPLRKSGALPLRKTGDEESHHQESQSEESHSCRPATLPNSGKIIQKNASSFSVEDDGRSPKQLAFSSPWEEVRARYEKASAGVPMNSKDEWWLKEHMELSGIAPERLLELVNENPLHRFASPMAGLKWLVKNFRTKSQSAVELGSEAGATSRFLAPVESPRCERCDNAGRVLERVEGERPRMTGEYCDCRMGNDLLAVERRKHAATTRASDGYTEPRSLPWHSTVAGDKTGDNRAVNKSLDGLRTVARICIEQHIDDEALRRI